MDSELDIVEERITRLENLVLGKDTKQKDDIQLLDTLLSIANKLASVASKNGKMATVMKRVEEIDKYCDPLYAESDAFVPEDVKYQLIVSEEEKLREALSMYEKLESLKPVLDSQAFQEVPTLGGHLSKISTIQANQEREMEILTTETYSLLQHYNEIVNGLSKNLAAIELAVSSLEPPKK